MPPPPHTVPQPRKQPVQQRSAASVDALLEASLQVLASVGKERLTTTRVAARAGVSVGTLYQYFPNKLSLLQATLRRHFDEVAAAVIEVCDRERGKPLPVMGAALGDAFLAAKLRGGPSSVALYAVSSDLDGVAIVQELKRKTHAAIVSMLLTAAEGPVQDAALVGTVMQGILSGLSRQLLESESPEDDYAEICTQLRVVLSAYLARCPQTPRS